MFNIHICVDSHKCIYVFNMHIYIYTFSFIWAYMHICVSVPNMPNYEF